MIYKLSSLSAVLFMLLILVACGGGGGAPFTNIDAATAIIPPALESVADTADTIFLFTGVFLLDKQKLIGRGVGLTFSGITAAGNNQHGLAITVQDDANLTLTGNGVSGNTDEGILLESGASAS